MEFCGIAVRTDWTAIAAFVAAAIALFAAYQNAKTSREAQKASVNVEFMRLREKWITDLRILMAEYVSIGVTFNMIQGKASEKPEVLARFHQLHSEILLMMNPEKHQKSLDFLKRHLKDSESSDYYGSFSKLNTSMKEIGQLLTKDKSVGVKLASLEILFHSYLRYHWLNLQNENLNPYA